MFQKHIKTYCKVSWWGCNKKVVHNAIAILNKERNCADDL